MNICEILPSTFTFYIFIIGLRKHKFIIFSKFVIFVFFGI